MYQYGARLIRGEGAPKDAKEGFIWVQRAAFVEYTPAEYLVGTLLIKGEGTSQDVQKGLSYIEKAAQKNNILAQKLLAYYYEQGQYLPKDNVMAYVYYALAYDNAQNGKQIKLSEDSDVARIELLLSAEQKSIADKRYMALRPKRDAKPLRAKWF
jgi:TPR repeat protein